MIRKVNIIHTLQFKTHFQRNISLTIQGVGYFRGPLNDARHLKALKELKHFKNIVTVTSWGHTGDRQWALGIHAGTVPLVTSKTWTMFVLLSMF